MDRFKSGPREAFWYPYSINAEKKGRKFLTGNIAIRSESYYRYLYLIATDIVEFSIKTEEIRPSALSK